MSFLEELVFQFDFIQFTGISEYPINIKSQMQPDQYDQMPNQISVKGNQSNTIDKEPINHQQIQITGSSEALSQQESVKTYEYFLNASFKKPQIFQETEKQAKLLKRQQKQENQVRILQLAPDITTYVWNENKYRLGSSKSICIASPGGWLCSSDLPSDGEFVFNINAINVTKGTTNGVEYSHIGIGIMESEGKMKSGGDIWKYCVQLSLRHQIVYRPNEEQTDQQFSKCFVQPSLSSLPCLIQFHINRQQNKVTWFYNGKKQAKVEMLRSWKGSWKNLWMRKTLCAVVFLSNKDDSVEFL